MAKTLLIYSGGTIGMKANSMGNNFTLTFSQLKKLVPELNHEDIAYSVLPTVQDSSNVSPADWITIKKSIVEQASAYENFVVLHGTDTLCYTSSAMSFLLADFQKNVVFTGAQIPLWDINTDGKKNLLGALNSLEQFKNHQIKGQVALFFSGQIFQANRSVKYSSTSFDGFVSPNFPTFNFNREWWVKKQMFSSIFSKVTNIETNLRLLKVYPGINLIQEIQQLKKTAPKGIIIESFGAGNIPENKRFIEGLKEVMDTGTLVMNISQCLAGGVDMNKYDTGKQLLDLGVINGKDITLPAAISKFMLVLSLSEPNKHHLLSHSIAGEMTD